MSIRLLALCLLAACAGAGEAITARGSITMKGLVEAEAKAWQAAHPDAAITVTGTVTKASIDAVGKGEAQLGMVLRELSAAEKTEYPDLKTTAIGLDGVVLVVHAGNSVANLSKDQLIGLYTGAIANWKEVGGPDLAVLPVARNENFATLQFFEEVIGLEHQVADKAMRFRKKGGEAFGTAAARMTGDNKEGLALVAQKAEAISFAPLGDAAAMAKAGRVKILSLDGVEATPALIRSGGYPLRRSLFLLTKGEAGGLLADFIAFCLGADGQRIVGERGFVPLAP